MENGLDLKVNRLPVRTWNRLKMNEARLERIAAGKAPAVITEGFLEPEAWEEDFSSVATGMGRDMDRLRDAAEADGDSDWDGGPSRPGRGDPGRG